MVDLLSLRPFLSKSRKLWFLYRLWERHVDHPAVPIVELRHGISRESVAPASGLCWNCLLLASHVWHNYLYTILLLQRTLQRTKFCRSLWVRWGLQLSMVLLSDCGHLCGCMYSSRRKHVSILVNHDGW